MAENKPMPSGNIEWTKIPKDAEVFDCGNHFQACGAVVFWGSQDAKEAQLHLAERARKTAKKPEPAPTRCMKRRVPRSQILAPTESHGKQTPDQSDHVGETSAGGKAEGTDS